MNARRKNRGILPHCKQAKKFTSCYAKRPIQCQCCQDYILGTSLPLRVCQDCKAVLHPICALFAHSVDCVGSANEEQIRSNEINLSNVPTSIAEWSADRVREWIGASESHRYFYIFNSKGSKFTGENLINPDTIISSVRADDLHKIMLREAIMNAQHHFPLQSLEGDSFTNLPMSPKPIRRDSWDRHEFSPNDCYCTFHCAMCKLSRGVMSYGVKCRKCGMRFHRMCQHVPDLPPCPIRECPKKDYVFGQDLSFVFSPPKYQIPVFLKLCTSVIEERLQPTDLNIYVSSARCTRLQELCSNHGLDIFYDEKNPMKRPSPPVTLPEELEKELKSVRSLDELAGLLKSYLRELPNPVIPFNVYDDMIAMAKKSNPTDDEIDCVVQKIPLPHRYALSHILEHIGRIHDFLGASHKLSTLFAAFGTILIRPPVTSVKSLALWDRGSDLHSVIVKFVFGNIKFKDVTSSSVSASPVTKSPNYPSFPQTPGLPAAMSGGQLSAPAGMHSSSPVTAASLPLDSDGTTTSSLGAANSDVYIQFTEIDEGPPTAVGLDQRFGNKGPVMMGSDEPGTGHGFGGNANYQSMKKGGSTSGSEAQPMIMSQKRVEELSEYSSIQKLPFYWEDISKTQEKLLMEKEAIGNFILRKSSSDPSALTLVVKGFDVNFLVKVSNYLRPKEGWAIAAHAPKFPSMGDLVQRYQSNDLSTSPLLAAFSCSFDDEKNSAAASITSQTRQSVRLREPVNRDLREDILATKERLVNDSRDMDERENAIAELKRKLSFIKDTEIPPFVKRKDALQKLCRQLENQQQALQSGKRNLSPEDRQKLVASEELLASRLNVALMMIKDCDASLDRLHRDKVSIEGELQKSSNEYSDEVRQQTRRRIVLEIRGVQYEDDRLTEQQLFNRENQSLWFYRNSVTRDMATQMFELCREHGQITNGTFLVRSSREGGYAISVWVNGDVMHLKLQYEDQKYGFAYPYINYSSITDLVVAYTENSLVMHNHNLDTTLTTPIGYFVEENLAIKKQVEIIFK